MAKRRRPQVLFQKQKDGSYKVLLRVPSGKGWRATPSVDYVPTKQGDTPEKVDKATAIKEKQVSLAALIGQLRSEARAFNRRSMLQTGMIDDNQAEKG